MIFVSIIHQLEQQCVICLDAYIATSREKTCKFMHEARGTKHQFWRSYPKVFTASRQLLNR